MAKSVHRLVYSFGHRNDDTSTEALQVYVLPSRDGSSPREVIAFRQEASLALTPRLPLRHHARVAGFSLHPDS